MILAGDIGGTKTVVGLYEEGSDGLRQLREETYRSKEHASLTEILGKFLAQGAGGTIRAGCFGVAGAVIDGKCHTTNLPWELDEGELAKAIGAASVKLLNDLEAAAYGMLFLKPEELRVLNSSRRPKRVGNVAVIAAGTGLGEAMLFWDGSKHYPIASEGGHCDFAPRTEQEIRLLEYLQPKFGGHVSFERVLSGPGFHNIYSFLRDCGYGTEPEWLSERLKTGDPSITITEVGLAGKDPLCVATLELFCSLYGAEAGNLALKCVGVGGVFVGGGIAPKMLPAIEKGSFMRGFTAKGRFKNLMESIEVSVALNPRAPLLGAAHWALRV